MLDASLTERIVRQERLIIGIALLCITLLAWFYILSGAGTGMSVVMMSTLDFPAHIPLLQFYSTWSTSYALIMLAMWWVMMIAMMLPGAAPMILLYARVMRNNTTPASRSPFSATACFAGGYLTVWLLFSLAAVFFQWLLEYAGVLHGMMMWSTSTALSAMLLIGAGAYQLSSLKETCLRHCRSPVEYISNQWRQGLVGAFSMGLTHGLFCVGCCWALMLLLFVGGAMNLVWIAGLSVLVLIEKLLPRSGAIVYISGGLLIVSGVVLLVVPLISVGE